MRRGNTVPARGTAGVVVERGVKGWLGKSGIKEQWKQEMQGTTVGEWRKMCKFVEYKGKIIG